jgi:hypothetical protein
METVHQLEIKPGMSIDALVKGLGFLEISPNS